uniref:Uncharacterized protein n=1 Tax=Candidatus Kentrum sp. MB TaxID=2138164 RepID=A0A451BAR9_9GAMM|nr:MAG: hypothetical protein BECKMB1821G_GA0114241_100837 [Candidatus Kentron sp. MB]VFK30669.1 MAG: hypothetical protein BECKMB1821I_GA0114274_101713 [Candidatus Kentron sp. MB]VFK75354.1 MAG: hypothetical protein BECKMB1821H_GA0114242_102029 [Candidatus Kentron sp. MB]
MPIQYALFDNNLISDPDDYPAHVQLIGSGFVRLKRLLSSGMLDHLS